MTESIKVKICGISTKDALDASVSAGADYIGCVFYKYSPRYISPKDAGKLTKNLPKHVKKVAVLVDASKEELAAIMAYFKPDYLQLHGKEDKSQVIHIRQTYHMPIIKAARISCSDDVAKALQFKGISDMLLFDAKAPSTMLPGGNGLVFDWALLRARKIDVPWFLSGGLNLQNITNALSITSAKMVDVSSSLESSPGKKDPQLIKTFIEKVKEYGSERSQ